MADADMTTELSRSLRPRHLTMISIGGIIGAGLFVGSSAAIKATGPAVVLSYLLTGALILLVMRMIGEMATMHPGQRAFTEARAKELYVSVLAFAAVGAAYLLRRRRQPAEGSARSAIRKNMAQEQKIEPSTHGLWAATAPSLMTQPLTERISADLAIIGAGYTGLSTALHVREFGLSAVVLDAVDVGFGGAGRNVGLVNAGLWLQPRDVIKALGTSYGERLIAELGNAPQRVFELIDRHGIACEAKRNGTLHCAVGSKGLLELEQRQAQWRERGAPVELLTREQSLIEVGSSAFAGALLDRRAGTVQPLAYARGLANAAIAAGARIHSQSPVNRVERQQTRWELSTPRGGVSADWLVVATDAYTKGPWAEIRHEQVALPYFNLATRPLPSKLLEQILPSRRGAWDTQSVLTSFRLDDAGRLIFGSVGALRGWGAAVHTAFARRALRTLFPQLAEVEFEHAWYGTIGMTSNSIPRFHRFGPNAIGVSGYNGRGIAPGTAFGRLLAQHVAGKVSEQEIPLPVTRIVPPNLRQLKELTYEYGAQLAHLLASR